ncbi:hypothetical protein P152DRAFT_380009, partial [Eremomyces bilateralis CBS 781.70]
RSNPNINGFSEALACYPFVSQLATFVDLNTLDALSRTCRQFRVNLLQFRPQLMAQSLRCFNNRPDSPHARLTSGKVGQCAIDQVGECRRCGIIVCRNCTTKPPLNKSLPERHRRICKRCIKAPLHRHMTLEKPWHTADALADLFTQTPDPNDSASSSSSRPSSLRTNSTIPTPSSSPPDPDTLYLSSRPSTAPPKSPNPPPPPTAKSSPPSPLSRVFTYSAFLRTPCTCADAVFLCHACGIALRQSDSTYIRAWKWRTHYTTFLGGLGTGIGEGHEGVECGRGGDCLGARVVEKEGTVAADGLGAGNGEDGAALSRTPTGRSWEGSSYHAQEIEGVGGTVKKKVKKLVRVGLVVREHEAVREHEGDRPDEKKRDMLAEERGGEVRSWCGWCDRVILGRRD